MPNSVTISEPSPAVGSGSHRAWPLGTRITHGLAVVVSAMALLLIIAGGAVTSTRSGDTEPTWSLRFWEWFQPWGTFQGGHLIEMSHRQIGTVVGFLTIALVAFLWKTETRRWVKNLGYTVLVLVIVQGVLGGLRVLVVSDPGVQNAAAGITGGAHPNTLRVIAAMIHGTLGPAVFAMMVSIAVATARAWQKTAGIAKTRAVASLRQLSLVTLGALIIQLALGTYLRHAGWMQFAVLVHGTGALVVAFCSVVIAFRAGAVEKEVRAVRGPAISMAVLIQFQIFMGVFSLVVPLALAVRTFHQVMGSVLLALCLVIVLRVFNLLKPVEVR